MARGKAFERELRKAFVARYPTAYVERNPDRLTGKGGHSVPSPPDLLVNAAHCNYLIECKAIAGKSLPFSNLSPHQHDHLMRYEEVSNMHKGFVAVNFYNNKKGRFNRAWLVPIGFWSEYQSRMPRKSLAMADLERLLPEHEMIRGKGSVWILPRWT